MCPQTGSFVALLFVMAFATQVASNLRMQHAKSLQASSEVEDRASIKP